MLSEYKLTVQQYNILRILRGQFPETASIGTIKERMLDKNSDITRIIDRLIIKQLAERKNSISDRRVAEIKITKKGLRLLEKMDLVDLKSDNILSHVNETDLKKLNELLDKTEFSPKTNIMHLKSRFTQKIKPFKWPNFGEAYTIPP